MDSCKQCSLCKSVKPLSDFYRRSAMADGRRSECKQCFNIAKLAAYRRNDHVAERIRASCRERNGHERAVLIDTYGGKCACCGISTPEFLSIDHINGRLPEHSRSCGKMSGHRLVAFLKRNGYPRDNYQLLCYNCNCAKGILGECPHSNSRHLPAVLVTANK